MNQGDIIQIAKYMIANKCTLREAAEVFNISKSCIHYNIHNRLIETNWELYYKVTKLLKRHSEQRASSGGEATKRKYNNGK